MRDDELTDPRTNPQIIADGGLGRPAPPGLEQCPLFDPPISPRPDLEEKVRAVMGSENSLDLGDGARIEPGLHGSLWIVRPGREDVKFEDADGEDLAAVEDALAAR